MAETVSSTVSFTLAVDEVIEEALDMIGGEHTSAYDSRSARRSLNLLLTDLSNREYPLAHLEQRSLSLLPNISSYTLESDVLGILDLNFKNSDGVETQIAYQSPFDFFNIAEKTETGNQPAVYTLQTNTIPAVLKVWPVPIESGTSLEYWVMRRHKDVTKSYELVDLSYRYLPALTMGLAYFMSFKRPGLDPMTVDRIAAEYERRLELAFSQDRERSDFQVYPDVGG